MNLERLPVQDPNDPDFAHLRKYMIDLINQNYRQPDGSPGDCSEKDVNQIVGALIFACLTARKLGFESPYPWFEEFCRFLLDADDLPGEASTKPN